MASKLVLRELSLDHLIYRLVTEIPDRVLISYPSQTSHGFEDFTAVDLDKLTKSAISMLPEHLKAPMHDVSPGERPAVAIVGVSNLEYYLYLLAVQRLGWRTLLMSPRLADQGFAHLIRQTECKTVLASGAAADAMQRVKDAESFDLEIIPMLPPQTLKEAAAVVVDPAVVAPDLYPPMPELKSALDSPQLIIHSSGTTGLPKPVPMSSGEWLLQNAAMIERIPQFDTLTTLPVFHSFGIGLLFRMLLGGRRLSVVSAERPVTASGLLEALDQTGAMTVVTVPQVLKFCAETEGGAARLAQVDSVVCAGSAVPQQLGDEMVEKGVAISTIYGQTESGGLMQPGRGKDWCWVSPLPHAEPFMEFEPVQGDENLCHLVILKGLPTKMLSNRDDGSYGTNDLFERHPSDPRKWRFAGRADDIIVLANGEKADPTPLEQALSLNPHVNAAVVFGAGHDWLGVLVVPSEAATGLSEPDLLDSIKPQLELGNTKVPAYARVSTDGVIFKEIGFSVPMTAKSTLIRSRLLELCREDIECFYAKNEQENQGHVAVTDENVNDVVRGIVSSILPVGESKLTDDADFFSMGMDSLQASHVRSQLLKGIDLGGRTLLANVAFDHPSVSRLSQHILDVQNGVTRSRSSESLKSYAEGLVQKYTQFPKMEPSPEAAAPAQAVLLTGATGTIGGHILHYLACQPSIHSIYCLVRAESDVVAGHRVLKTLTNARLDDLNASQMAKIVPLASEIGEPRLGLSEDQYQAVRKSVTTIIHGAWAVNFNMSLRSFENPYIASVSHLLRLAMESPWSSKPTFCLLSSVASSLRSKDCPIREVQYEWEAASDMGYGQSKWVAEKMCHAAAQHAESCGVDLPVKILRVGQVAGDTRYGIWNPTETIPIIVQSAITTGVLPITTGPQDTQYWLPVDLAAGSIVELALQKSPAAPETTPQLVFHVANTAPLRWSSDVLPALRRQGMPFEAVPASDWLRRLEDPELKVEENPAYHLLEWLKRRYDEPSAGPEFQNEKREMDLTNTRQYSSTLRDGVEISDELIGKFLRHWTQLDDWQRLKRNGVGTALVV